MKTIVHVFVVICSLIFELLGRVLAQIAQVSMSIAEMLLRSISRKEE